MKLRHGTRGGKWREDVRTMMSGSVADGLHASVDITFLVPEGGRTVDGKGSSIQVCATLEEAQRMLDQLTAVVAVTTKMLEQTEEILEEGR